MDEQTVKHVLHVVLAAGTSIMAMAFLGNWVADQKDKTIEQLSTANEDLWLMIKRYNEFSDLETKDKVWENVQFDWIAKRLEE